MVTNPQLVTEEMVRKTALPPDYTGELTKQQLELLPKGMRICIPIKDRHSLRRVADLLHGYATAMEVAARRTDISDKEAIVMICYECGLLNKKIRFTTKSGRTGGD
jgi:hypothetical protein